MQQQYTATTRQIFSVFWRHTMRYRGWVALSFGAIIAYNVTNLAVPWLYRQFFNVIVAAGPTASGELLRILGFVFLLYAATNFFRRVAHFVNVYVQSRVMTDLQQTSETYLLNHSYHFFANNFAGSLVRRVNKLSRAYEDITDKLQFSVLPLLVSVAVILPVLFIRHVLLGSALLIWILVFALLSYAFARWKQPYDIARSAKDSEATGVLADIIGNSAAVQLFTGQADEAQRYQHVTNELDRIRRYSWNLNEKMDLVHALLAMTTEVGLMIVAVRLWQRGLLTVGDFALIQAYFIVLLNRIWDLGSVIRRVYEGLSDASEMVGILNTTHDIEDSAGARSLMVTNARVEFRTVTFGYHRSRRVLDGFSLVIKPGERVALVGSSGAGKSTVTKLLFRLYSIDEGAILIDNQNIADVTLQSLRQRIALVPQEPTLFHRTIRENIRYGRRDANDAAIEEAARQAHCTEFIANLPNGYDTYVGERGVKLSGGERQRIAIARAIVKDAPLLVLDEATSSLDSESEALIQDALKVLMHGRTTIVIAHRLSTIMQMDRIVVVEGGRLADSGSHAELLARAGTYQRLWNIQAGGFIP